MNEYTFSDLIVNPETPDLEDLIGKEVYFSNVPGYCLGYANEGDSQHLAVLIGIEKDNVCPFCIKNSDQREFYSCIIVKKEEPKPKFVPFENVEEFLDAYYRSETKNLNRTYRYLATHGIWLKDKSTEVGVYCMVTKVWDNGLVVCDVKMSTDGTIEFNNIISWSELYESFTFLDGSPCGSLKEQQSAI